MTRVQAQRLRDELVHEGWWDAWIVPSPTSSNTFTVRVATDTTEKEYINYQRQERKG